MGFIRIYEAVMIGTIDDRKVARIIGKSFAAETSPRDHLPMLSDLGEQDADMVAFIFREEVYRPDKESLKGLAELILAKQRNGPTGRLKLAYLNRYTKFEKLAADTGAEEDAPFE